jgi:hypothetical protein
MVREIAGGLVTFWRKKRELYHEAKREEPSTERTRDGRGRRRCNI